MSGHHSRVSSLSWNGPLLSSGGRDSTILHHDVRVLDDAVGTLRGHTQEVCGLKWSPAGNLLASGGNDNTLNIWDDRYRKRHVPVAAAAHGGVLDTPLYRIGAHKAAIKGRHPGFEPANPGLRVIR